MTKNLRESINDYLLMRHSMGSRVEGLQKLLMSFVTFCEEKDVNQITNAIALEWATTTMRVPVTDQLIARRMDAVRIIARYQQAIDPTTEVPPETICGRRYRPLSPNVFSGDDVANLMRATSTLNPAFKALTWRCLIGLLASTGLRPGEACRLHINDLDTDIGMVQVLDTKFGKSRIVYLHPTTTIELIKYLKVRDDWVAKRSNLPKEQIIALREAARIEDIVGQVVTSRCF